MLSVNCTLGCNGLTCTLITPLLSLHKQWSFPFRVSSVNMTKSARNCGFAYINWGKRSWRTSFLVQCVLWLFSSFNVSFFVFFCFFFHCNWYFWSKKSLWHQRKYDHFCLSNLILHWLIFEKTSVQV